MLCLIWFWFTKHWTKVQKYNQFLHEVTRNWIMEQGDMADDSAVPLFKRPTPREPAEDLPGRLSGNFSRQNLGKIVGVGQGKKGNILLGNVGSVLHTKSRMKHTFVSFVLCHLTEEGALKNITPSNIIRLYLCCKHQMTSWCINCNTEVHIETSYALKIICLVVLRTGVFKRPHWPTTCKCFWTYRNLNVFRPPFRNYYYFFFFNFVI